MTAIVSFGTALPEYAADNADILEAVSEWLGAGTEDFGLFERFLRSSHTQTRHFIAPPMEILSYGGSAERAERFEREAARLAEIALRRALADARMDPSELDGIIFTSCSCPMIPAVDTYLVDRLELKREIVRVPSYQFGCAGGLVGLGLAHRLAPSVGTVAVVGAELCSLVFQAGNKSPSNLVGAAIFGDGAAAAIVSPQDAGLRLIAHCSRLLPQSRHLMGYEIRDDGNHVRLDKDLPMHLAEELPRFASEFLRAHGLERKDVSWWLFHPGGAKILRFLQDALEIPTEICGWAAEVLGDPGNLSSATILFVADRFMRSNAPRKPGDKVLFAGVGPGLTIELMLAECR